MSMRVESDTMGTIEVPADKYYGAQTARSLMNFDIGGEKMPTEIVTAFGVLKKAAALANHKLGLLDEKTRDLIVAAAASWPTIFRSSSGRPARAPSPT
jgi:fumarate hydratase class II